MIFLWAFLGIYLGVIALYLLGSGFIKFQRKRFRAKQKWAVLSVRVSKENEAGPIVAEQIFSTIHGIHDELGFFDRLRGATADMVSFEIAKIGDYIKFFVAFPAHLRNLVEGQLYAQYPDTEIFEEEDYASQVNDAEKKYAISTTLGFDGPPHDPIKRWPQFEDKLTRVHIDPMAGITATLTKFNDSREQAWIQILVRPLDDKWRFIYQKSLRIQSKGIFANIETLQDMFSYAFCTRKTLLRIVFFPLYFMFWIQGLMSATKVSFSGPVEADFEEETSKGHERETTILAAYDKIVKLMFDVTIRITYVPVKHDPAANMVKLKEIAGAFKQFNMPHLNAFSMDDVTEGEEAVMSYQRREMSEPLLMNIEELATVYHLPTNKVQTPMIYWVKSRKLEPPADLPSPEKIYEDQLTVLGRTNFRGIRRPFGIFHDDRRRHMYIIGKTGMGKSTLLENMILADIQAGRGVGIVDPHGDLADRIFELIPSHRTNDVILFDPSDRDFPVGFNMLDNIDPAYNPIVASGLVGIFKKIYAESWGPRLEHILRNTILSLLETPNTTMLGITRILQDREYREQIVRKITDPTLKSFWANEFEKMPEKDRMTAISPILNKVGQFLASPITRNILGQPKSALDLRFAMDKRKIVIVNLSKGKIGEDTSSLLGSMIITKFQLDAMSRANVAEKERTDFYLYVDEFQNFATESFATILSEARKYRLNLTMANQYIAQMPDEVRSAVFGNVGTMISFQIGFEDAEFLSGQLSEEAMPNDLTNLSKYSAYIKLLIDGMPSRTFSMETLPPAEIKLDPKRREKILKYCRERYATKREIVEEKIRKWAKMEEY